MADAGTRIAEEVLKAGGTAAVTIGCPLMGAAIGAAIYAPDQVQAAAKAVQGPKLEDDEGDEA